MHLGNDCRIRRGNIVVLCRVGCNVEEARTGLAICGVAVNTACETMTASIGRASEYIEGSRLPLRDWGRAAGSEHTISVLEQILGENQ